MPGPSLEAKLVQYWVFLLSSIVVPAAEYAHTCACHDNDILDVEGHIHSVQEEWLVSSLLSFSF